MNVTGCRPLWSSRFLFFFRPRVLQVPTRLERERNKELIRVGQKKQEEEEEEEKEESERIEKKKKRKGQPPFVGCDRGLRRAMQLATQLSPGQIKLPVHRAIVLALSLTLFVVFVASSSFLPSFLSSSSSSPPIPRSLSALVSLLVTHTHTHTNVIQLDILLSMKPSDFSSLFFFDSSLDDPLVPLLPPYDSFYL